MATLKDIGEELGLSVATVSRALNGFPEVNQKTRDKVQQAANRLGYRPNRVAQRLVTGRSGMVGMIVKIKPDMSADQTFFEMLTGLTAALAARDADLVLAVDPEGADPVAPYKRMMERDILDGFILNAPEPNDPRVSFLLERGIPFALHGQTAPDVDYPFFTIDNHAVTEDAVNLLVNLGHRRIALLNGDLRHAYAVERLEGFRRGCAAAGFGVPDYFVTTDAPTESAAYVTALRMLSAEFPPTAVICASTAMAAGVYRAAKDRGVEIPADLSVIAHDDALPLVRAINFAPALTVTRAPLRDACVPLANQLIDHINGTSGKDLQIRETAEMIVRGSTGPAPEGGDVPWH